MRSLLSSNVLTYGRLHGIADEAAGIHHCRRQRGGRVAARVARAAGRQAEDDRVPGPGCTGLDFICCCFCRAVGSLPSIKIVPDVGRSSVVNILIVVDLPAPFGPRNPNVVPRSTENEIPFTASKGPKLFFKSLTSMMSVMGNSSVASLYSRVTIAGKRQAFSNSGGSWIVLGTRLPFATAQQARVAKGANGSARSAAR